MDDSVEPLFRLEPDFEESDVKRVKLTENFPDGTKRTRETPLCDGKSIECIFFCIEEFHEVAKALDWTTSGPKLFDGFRQGLQGVARTKWDNIYVLRIEVMNHGRLTSTVLHGAALILLCRYVHMSRILTL